MRTRLASPTARTSTVMMAKATRKASRSSNGSRIRRAARLLVASANRSAEFFDAGVVVGFGEPTPGL